MYWSSPFRRTLNTGYVTGLDMCKVCTEAVHSVALSTRVTLGLGMCKVCTEAVHSVALWTRVTVGLGMCKVCTEAAHSLALWTRVTWQVWTCVHYVTMYWTTENSEKCTKTYGQISTRLQKQPLTLWGFLWVMAMGMVGCAVGSRQSYTTVDGWNSRANHRLDGHETL